MLDTAVLMTAFLGFSLLVLFHGCVLLVAPHRYLPYFTWGESSLKLARKPPIDFGKRFAGLLLCAVVVGIFIRPVVLWFLHPHPSKLSLGESPLPSGTARWDLLGAAICAIVGGWFLLNKASKLVEVMFAADRAKLREKATVRLWTFHIQACGFLMMLWSLLPAAVFIRSIHS